MVVIALYISRNFRTGGQKRYLDVLKGLAERGHEVHLVHRVERKFPSELTKRLDLHPQEVSDGMSQQRAFTGAMKNNVTLLADIGKSHLIFLFGESSLPCGIYLKRKLKIPLIVAIRNNFYIASRLTGRRGIKSFFKDQRNRLRERQLCKYSDKLIFQNEYDRDSILSRNTYPREKCEIIPNSIRASWFDDEWRQTNRSRSLNNIIFVGSDDKRKGFPWMLGALEKLRKDYSDFTLSLVGDFPRTNPDDLPPWVSIIGRLESPLERLSRSDLLIVPSLYDSFPNTVLEALFVGTPVIGTDIAGIKTMLFHSQLLFERENEKNFLDTIRPLFSDEDYQSAKAMCRERLKEFDFDWIGAWENSFNISEIEK